MISWPTSGRSGEGLGSSRGPLAQRLAAGQDLDELLDPAGAGLGALGVVDPEQERITLDAGEGLEECVRVRISLERRLEGRWHRGLALRCVCRIPPTVGFRPLDLRETGRAHP